MLYEVWKEYGILEELTAKPKMELFNLYSKEDSIFLKACEIFEAGFHEKASEIFSELLVKEPENIDYAFAFSVCNFHLHSLEKTILLLNKCVFISNSYHCYFHYFGFNLCMNLFKKTGEEKFFERAKFLYPEGLKSSENLENEALPSFKNLCIFQDSKTRKLPEMEAFEVSEKEHYEYHLLTAKIYFLRGLCFQMKGKLEIAKVDFEKALNMENKNPFNETIKKHYDVLRLP
jgi:tetratricopeptide (TPR) repeat protein